MIVEGISARRGLLQKRRVDAELQAELLEHLVAPLLDQTPRRNDQDSAGIRAHDELADVKPGHDRLTSTRVVCQQEAQRLARQH